MDKFLKLSFKNIIVKAVCFCLIGIILFPFNCLLQDKDIAIQQILGILFVSTLFFAYSLLASVAYIKIIRSGQKIITSFYILHEGIQILLAIGIIVFYAFARLNNLLTFSLNLFVLYIIQLITSVIYFIKMEHLIKFK